METKYSYEIWMSGCMLHSDNDFESEDEAREEATSHIDDIIEDWKIDDAYDGETVDDFEIIIKDYDVEEDY